MLKRTLFFENPYHLSVKNHQLVVNDKKNNKQHIVPSDDIGFVVFDHRELSYTQAVLQLFSEQNTAVIICNQKHLPVSILQSIDANYTQGQNTDYQLQASEPLKKQLWKQTIKHKIKNQAAMLKKIGKSYEDLLQIAKDVKSGDQTNREGHAAKIYWSRIFEDFSRQRFGDQPNSMLNYCYTILRTATAKAITGSGLLPVMGIKHHNKYNSYRLADDIMEPYRPYADEVVYQTYKKFPDYKDLTTPIKAELLKILTVDTDFELVKRPLSIGLTITSASLVKCYRAEARKIQYPKF